MAAGIFQQFVTVLNSVALSDWPRRCPLSRNNGGTELSKAEKNLISQLVLDNFLPFIQIFQINVANILQHAMDH